MKIKNLIKLSAFIFLLTGTYSCADLEVENLNSADRARALSTPEDVISLLNGGTNTFFAASTSFLGVNLDLQADIITSTNAANNYWGDADEPRRRINNSTTWDDKNNVEFLFNDCFSAIHAANFVFAAVNTDGLELVENDVDNTQKHLAAAYMLKGMGYGYLGYVYDKGYIVEFDAVEPPTTLVSYSDLIAEAVFNFEEAKKIYAANPSANWDYILDANLSSEEAIKLCNAYAARFMAGEARTKAEAASLDWTTIRKYSQEAITEDFSPTSVGAILSNGQHSWNTFEINADRAAYLPVDLQVCWLMDNDYPKSYPATGVLGPVNTDDMREQTDFVYTESLGWLREDRNRSIFSNYTFIRYQYNYQSTNDGNPMHIVTAAEMDLIEAEAEYMLGNMDAAKTIIDAGPRVTRGGLPVLADNSPATIERAIWYENMVELHSSGIGIALAYMRRWDRLQEGSYLQYPVPASELEITTQPIYTFGGAGFGNEEGTADGSNAWK